jgi:hypothetical protein
MLGERRHPLVAYLEAPLAIQPRLHPLDYLSPILPQPLADLDAAPGDASLPERLLIERTS